MGEIVGEEAGVGGEDGEMGVDVFATVAAEDGEVGMERVVVEAIIGMNLSK